MIKNTMLIEVLVSNTALGGVKLDHYSALGPRSHGEGRLSASFWECLR